MKKERAIYLVGNVRCVYAVPFAAKTTQFFLRQTAWSEHNILFKKM